MYYVDSGVAVLVSVYLLVFPWLYYVLCFDWRPRVYWEMNSSSVILCLQSCSYHLTDHTPYPRQVYVYDASGFLKMWSK